ncbi:MAG: alanine racemase [Acidimicrobiales bacterium]
MRPAWAEVDLGAVAANVKTLARLVAPAQVCAVVKADGYGHGAVAVARAALDAGAGWLGVALAEEGATLRDAGITAPILLLSEPQGDDMEIAVWFGLRPTVYTPAGVEAAARAAKHAVAKGAPLPIRVHLKVDTGMHRVGAAPADAVLLAEAVATHPELVLDGAYTHFAVADEPDDPFTDEQLGRFSSVLARLGDAGWRPPVVHAANSAAAITRPDSRFDLVRVGIAVYGIPPAPTLADAVELVPALSLKASVALVKEVGAGERISYGLRHTFATDSVVATVPIGYADGVRRRLFAVGGEVLLGGRRRPIAGVVTMDQLTVDCGDDRSVRAGDEVVLIGAQGHERITADDWAARLDTIAYEIVCGIGPRVPRRYR